MSKITNHKYSIEEAFKNCFYIVPDYQREFVWTDKEVTRLMEDIDNEMGNGNESEYFIGTILVAPTNQKNHFEVIDGQQRLTTFFLMLCALRVLFGDEEYDNVLSDLLHTRYTNSSGDLVSKLKLDPRYENAGSVLHAIVKSKGNPEIAKKAINDTEIKQFGSLDNLADAYNSVYRFIEANYQHKQDLKKFWGFLSNNVIFIQIETDVSSALKIFETINERGLGLNPMDLLKNLLFSNVDPNEFTQLKNEWKKITKPLEENKEKPLRFLRYFIMANYKIDNARKDSIVREDEIYDWFTRSENIEQCGYKKHPFEFVRKIINNVEHFIDFTKGKGNDGKENTYMDNIRKLAGGALSIHYVLLLSSYTLPKDLFDFLLKQLEVYLFYYIVTKTSTKVLERNFSNWADDLRVIASIQDKAEQRTRLNQFARDKFIKNTEAKQEEFMDALRRYDFHSLQQYRTRYILAKLTQYVDMAYQGKAYPGSLSNYLGLQIEHILPQNPTDELRQAFEGQNEEIDYDEYKKKLGNLTLLERPLNIVAGRSFFEDKKKEYAKSQNYLTSSISEKVTVGKQSSVNKINDKLLVFDKWNAEAIKKRQNMLANLAQDVWKMETLD